MPWMDMTGPMGRGPMTGRGRGCCNWGRGWRARDYGRGLSRYFGWGAPQTGEERKEALTEYLQALEEEVGEVKKGLTDLG